MKREINVNFGNLLDDIKIPKMYAVRQNFEKRRIENIQEETRKQLETVFGEIRFCRKKLR